MANVQSEEYGLLVTGAPIDAIYEAAKLDHDEFLGFEDGDLAVETHPWNPDYVFVSFLPDDEFGSDRARLGLPIPREPKDRTKPVRDWFKENLPEARLKWGRILTER